MTFITWLRTIGRIAPAVMDTTQVPWRFERRSELSDKA
jgi:hypothetical protein